MKNEQRFVSGILCIIPSALFCYSWRGCCPPRNQVSGAATVVYVTQQQLPMAVVQNAQLHVIQTGGYAQGLYPQAAQSTYPQGAQGTEMQSQASGMVYPALGQAGEPPTYQSKAKVVEDKWVLLHYVVIF